MYDVRSTIVILGIFTSFSFTAVNLCAFKINLSLTLRGRSPDTDTDAWDVGNEINLVRRDDSVHPNTGFLRALPFVTVSVNVFPSTPIRLEYFLSRPEIHVPWTGTNPKQILFLYL